MKNVSLIPYVSGAGGSTPGAEYGPLYAYAHGLDRALTANGIPATWHTDPAGHWSTRHGEEAHKKLEPRGHPSRKEIVKWHNEEIAKAVCDAIKSGKRAVTIGGDHSMAAGSVAGVRMAVGSDAKIGLIWVDAHTDLHTYASSTSKALHGMPVGSLLGLDDTLAIPGVASPVLTPDRIAYIGLRDVDDGEVINARNIGLPIPSLDELRQAGLKQRIQAEISRLEKICDQIVLSIDLDAFTETLAPAVGTMVPGGLAYDEVMPDLIDLVRDFSVPLIEVVELNPTLPGAEQTYQLLVRILTSLLSPATKSA